LYWIGATPPAAAAVNVILAPTICGALRSAVIATDVMVATTVTVKVPVALWAVLSVAVQVTVVVPAGKDDPLPGVQLTGTLPSTRSLADAV
jgi:hypothetical protein